jgi:hypothetical protein
VIGSALSDGRWDETAGGTLAGHGVPVTAGGLDLVLPLSLTIGAWLLDTAQTGHGRPGRPSAHEPAPTIEPATSIEPAAATESTAALESARPERSYVAVADDLAPSACAELGARLAVGSGRLALLVMADGSARRATTSPGCHDPRAVEFDTGVGTALGHADLDALLALDPEVARGLWVAGRPAWQVLAGAAQATYRADPKSHITAGLTYHAAPYGVGYFVADWLVGPPSNK